MRFLAVVALLALGACASRYDAALEEYDSAVTTYKANPSPETALAVEFAQQKAMLAQQDDLARRNRMSAAGAAMLGTGRGMANPGTFGQ